MDRRYQHLSSEERGAILAAHTDNKSARAIARMLGRTVSTVARELKRGLDPDAGGSPSHIRPAGISVRSDISVRLFQRTP